MAEVGPIGAEQQGLPCNITTPAAGGAHTLLNQRFGPVVNEETEEAVTPPGPTASTLQ